MATEVLEALFTAKETISDALDNISKSSIAADHSLDTLERQLQELGGSGALTREAFDELRDAVSQTDLATNKFDESVRDAQLALQRYNAGLISSEEATEEMRNALVSVVGASESADQQIDSLETTLNKLHASGLITDEAMDSLRNSFAQLSATAGTSNQTVQNLARGLSTASISTRQFDSAIEELTSDSALMSQAVRIAGNEAVKSGAKMQAGSAGADELSDEINEVTTSSVAASGSLGLLGSVAQSASVGFGSLSVNIGPFNIALRNIATQLPAIITGMGSMLAIVTALSAAFLTLATAGAAFFAGGAVAFFEEFSSQFEDGAEAVEAMMAALRELFIEAIRPLMTRANMDFFVDTINAAAQVVNQFAQFFQQMRDEVMGFFGDTGGDLETFFEALHDSFVIVEPVLLGFVNFFLNELPNIIVRFAKLTTAIESDLSLMLSAFGMLINQLLDFSSVIIAGLAPVVAALVGLLADVFIVLNNLNDTVVSSAVTFSALTLVLAKILFSTVSLAISIQNLTATMIANAAAGSTLGQVYTIMVGQVRALIAGEQTLAGALAVTKASISTGIVLWATRAQMVLLNSVRTNALTLAMIRQLGVIQAVAAGNIGLVAAMKLTAANMWMVIKSTLLLAGALIKRLIVAMAGAIIGFISWAVSAASASAATWSLVGAISTLLSPVTLVIGLVVALIGVLVALAEWLFDIGVFDWLMDKLSGIISFFEGLYNAVKKVIGLGGSATKAKQSMQDPTKTDDITTNPNVNLSFRDELNQQVDVQADPEDKEGLRRIVKDAINEANSTARRSEGVGR